MNYDMKCRVCGKSHEIERSMSDESDVMCPAKGCKNNKKAICDNAFWLTSSPISFKGWGWTDKYRT
jgi:predicted nucleic acid-binding Zn ribbon protein